MPSPRSRPKPKLNSQPSWQFEAIGTHWEVDIYEPVEAAQLARLQAEVAARIESFDRNYSRFREDSLVTKMSQAAGRYELPPDARPLLGVYRQLYDLSEGAVTPLVGQLLSDAGYDAQYSLKPGKLSRPPAWPAVMTYEYPYLDIKEPVLLDFGAAGKGYLVDLVAGILETYGLTAYCVDAGGDMLQRGPAPINVGLEHPADPTQAIGVAGLQNLSLCGSAGNRRAWAGLNHIMDPRTQTPAGRFQAVWVTAATTMLADALTTALYFVPPAALAEDFKYDYAAVHAGGSLEYSRNFPAEFFV